jgi:HlyD family secretion protein
MTRTLIRGGGTRLAAVGALSLSLAMLATGCGSETPTQPTARVERASVSNAVSASGALSSITSQNLGFPKGAQIREVTVKVGDTVQPGQVLARLDDFAFNQELNQQRAALANQQAQLNRLINGNTVEQAQRSLNAARDILNKTERNVSAQLSLDDTNINRARVAAANADRQVDFCRTHSQTTGRNSSALMGPNGSSQGTGVAPGADAGDPVLPPPPHTHPHPRTPPPPPPPLLVDKPFGGFKHGPPGQTNRAPTHGDRDHYGTLDGSRRDYYSAGEGGTDPCIQQVNASVQADTALRQAEKQKRVDDTQGQVSIAQARQGVVTAQNNLDTAGNDNGPNIEAQRALVAQQAAAVALAQRDVENTVLYAPVGGIVRTINGAVGEFVGAANGTTQLAPGSDAAIPGVGVAAPSQAGGNVITDSRGQSTFITLGNVNTFQVVVPFEESDASKVQPNQEVEATFDAVPDLVKRGTVLAKAPAGTDISGVTNYYATIVLSEGDPRLRDGMTAEAKVLTSKKENVLTVPNNAVINQGGKTFVSVPGPDGTPQQVPFQAGVVGDDRTEVLSGLTEGQEILLPQATVTPTPGGGGGGAGGGGGGGGR